MLRVRVNINDVVIIDNHVVRVGGGGEGEDAVNVYRLPDGEEFEHRYGDGAVELAKKVLDRTLVYRR